MRPNRLVNKFWDSDSIEDRKQYDSLRNRHWTEHIATVAQRVEEPLTSY